jgi:hypothetical protein
VLRLSNESFCFFLVSGNIDARLISGMHEQGSDRAGSAMSCESEEKTPALQEMRTFLEK